MPRERCLSTEERQFNLSLQDKEWTVVEITKESDQSSRANGNIFANLDATGPGLKSKTLKSYSLLQNNTSARSNSKIRALRS